MPNGRIQWEKNGPDRVQITKTVSDGGGTTRSLQKEREYEMALQQRRCSNASWGACGELSRGDNAGVENYEK